MLECKLECALCGLDNGKGIYFGSSIYCQPCFKKIKRVLKLLENNKVDEVIKIMEKALDDKEKIEEGGN